GGCGGGSEDLEAGEVGAAAPVRVFRGRVVAAVNVSAPKFRLGRSLAAAAGEVKAAADRLSAALAAPGPAGPAGPGPGPAPAGAGRGGRGRGGLPGRCRFFLAGCAWMPTCTCPAVGAPGRGGTPWGSRVGGIRGKRSSTRPGSPGR